MEPTEHTHEKPERLYRCVAASVEGFVQQVAVSYIRTGHYFYVPGRIQPDTDPTLVDQKIIDKYDINVSRWTRALRKQRGEANLQYIRYNGFFLIMATHGTSTFFELEGEQVKDCRRMPIKFEGYSLSYRGGHPHVRLNLEEYDLFKADMVDFASRLSRVQLENVMSVSRYAPYAPVRRQLWKIWREVNRCRAEAGLEPITQECLPLRRRIVKPFGEVNWSLQATMPSDYVLLSVTATPGDQPGQGTAAKIIDAGEIPMNSDDDFRQLTGASMPRSGLAVQPTEAVPEAGPRTVSVPMSVEAAGELYRRGLRELMKAAEVAKSLRSQHPESPGQSVEQVPTPAVQPEPTPERFEFPKVWEAQHQPGSVEPAREATVEPDPLNGLKPPERGR